MKKFTISRRQLFLYTAVLTCFAILLVFLFGYRQDEKQFSNLTHELFVSEMTSNTLNMHYTLAQPQNFGIHHYKPVLPTYPGAENQDAPGTVDSVLTRLSDIQPSKLSESDAYTYKLLTKTLENSQNMNRFALYQKPLSPSSGMQSQLPILLAEYRFRTVRDIEDYLALLDQTDEYFASLLLFEQEKLNAGFPMSNHSIRQVKEQCDTILTQASLKEGTHFLQTTFLERLEPFIAEGTITKQQAQKYIVENDRLLSTVMQPAYEALADGMFLMEDAPGVAPLPCGLSAYPNGQEYYRYLLISDTGSYRSVEEVKALVEQNLQSEYDAIVKLVADNPQLAPIIENQSYTDLPINDAASMLNDLQIRMNQDFPMLPEDLQTSSDLTTASREGVSGLPRVSVKPVSASLQEYCAPAFYLTAPLDDTANNAIYINEKNPITDLELYTTLAHEGYPGHLYQTVYDNRHCMNQNTNKARHLLWYGGYLEGWALYVEFYGYEYAAELLKEQNRMDDALCVQLEQHNRNLLLGIYSILDIMIHYENASPKDVSTFLESFGIKNQTAAQAVYCYIADEPCNYLKYYLGYLEIKELKKEAQAQWGRDYSDFCYHKFLLETGPSDFTSLREALTNYTPDSSSSSD